MKQKKTVLLLVAFICTIGAKSQYYFYNNSYYDSDVIWEFGGSAGLMNGITDIGAKKGAMPGFNSAQLNGSIYAGILYHSVAGLRLEATWGRIAGADSTGANPGRNLSFRTPINEVALIGEFHPLMLGYHEEAPVFSPYIAVGVGRFSFNPQAKLGDQWIDLQPLRTEGQGFPETAQYGITSQPYKLNGTNFIGGFGLKMEASSLIVFRGEFLFRKTTTDYLDDASTLYIDPSWFDAHLSAVNAGWAKQLFDRSTSKNTTTVRTGSFIRGNQKTNDSYFTINFKVGITLGRQGRR